MHFVPWTYLFRDRDTFIDSQIIWNRQQYLYPFTHRRRQEIHAKRMDRMMQQRIEQEITRMDKLDHVSTIHRKQEYRKQKMLAKMVNCTR